MQGNLQRNPFWDFSVFRVLYLYMIREKIKKTLVFSVFLIGFLNFLAMKFYLFWTIFWFDMLMHFLGGFFIGLLAIYLFVKNPKYKNMLFVSFLSIFIVGILWEVFELYFGMTDINSTDYFSDTGMDFIMDFLGAFVSVIYCDIKLNFKLKK